MTTTPTFDLPIPTPAARAGHFADAPPGRPATPPANPPATPPTTIDLPPDTPDPLDPPPAYATALAAARKRRQRHAGKTLH